MILEPDPAHHVAEVFSRRCALQIRPTRRTENIKSIAHAGQHRVLRNARMTQEVGADAEATLLIEGKRKGFRENFRLHRLRLAVRYFHFGNLRE